MKISEVQVPALADSSITHSGVAPFARVLEAADWSLSPLGPYKEWPTELRTTAQLALNAQHPACVYWGPSYAMIYNEAFAPLVAANGPALGRPAAEVWGDWWAEISADFVAIGSTGVGLSVGAKRFEVEHDGVLCEEYWDYAFTPISDATGHVLGIYATARETTATVQERLTSALLLQLDTQLADSPSIDDMIEATLALIGKHLDAERTGYGEVDVAARQLHIRACWVTGTMPDIRGRYPLGNFGRLSDDLATGRAVVIEDNRLDPRTSEASMIERYERIGLRSGIVVPILDQGRYAGGLFVQRGQPSRWMPHIVALAEAATQRLWHAISRKRGELSLRASEQRYRLIFEQAEDIIFTADLEQRITDANEAGARAIGLSRDRLIGRSIAEFVDAEGFRQTSAMLQTKIDGGGNTRHEVPVVAADGRRMRWENNSTLIVDGEHRPMGLLSISRDVTERRAFEERQALLIHELNHRVKNTLALVQAIAHQSFRPGVDGDVAQVNFMARVRTLAAAHDLLTREQWEGVTMVELVRAATAPLEAARVAVSGDALAVTPKAAVALAMALHELGTNAVKYGALSTASGHVAIGWRADHDRFMLEWIEIGGPAVAPPNRNGFGVKMIERALASDLGGDVSVLFDVDGIRCTIDAPRKGNVT